MGKISSTNPKFGKADIVLDDGLIKIFVKRHNGICSEIKIWRLPLKRSFWSMFNLKNLIWAVYNDDAKFIHGWFAREGDFLVVLAKEIEKCNNYEELKKLLIKIENIAKGIIPPYDQ